MPEELDIEETQTDQVPPQTDPDKPLPLNEPDRIRLDSIVQKMIKNKEPEENIRFVVDDFKSKYAPKPQPKPVAPQPKPSAFNFKTPFKTVSELTPDQVRDAASLPVPEKTEDEVALLNEGKGAVERLSGYIKDSDRVIRKMQADEHAKEMQAAYASNDPERVASFQAKMAANLADVLGGSRQVVKDIKAQAEADPNKARQILKESTRLAPEKKNQIEADIFLHDAQEDIGSGFTKDIKEAHKLIQEGKAEYDPVTRRLTRPSGTIESFARGWKDRKNDLNLFDEYMSNENGDDFLMKTLDEERAKYNPYKPQPKGEGVGGFMGEMTGGNVIPMAKGLVVSAPLTAIGVPEAGAVVAAAVNTPEYANRAFIGTIRQIYNDELSKGTPKEEAFAKAKQQAIIDAVTAGAQGALQTYAGVKIGSAPTSGFKWSPGFRGTMNGILKQSGNFVKNTAKISGPNAAITGGLEVAKNAASELTGVDRELNENVYPAMAGQLMFEVGLGLIGKGFSGVKKLSTAKKNSILQNISKQPDETINSSLETMVSEGNLTPDEAANAKAAIDEHRVADSRIPPEITNEDVRSELKDKLDRYEELNLQLKGEKEGAGKVSDAFKSGIKKELEDLEFDIEVTKSSPDEQLRLLKSKKSELEGQIKEHDDAKAEGKEGKLENRAEVKSQLAKIDKRLQEVQEKVDDPIYKAQKIVEKGEIQGFSKEIIEDAAANDPETFRTYLQNIAEQAQDPLSAQTTIETYGKDLVNIADEMFPQKRPAAVIMPDENKSVETITIAPNKSLERSIDTPPPVESESVIDQSPEEPARLSHAETEKIYQEQGLPGRMETPTQSRETLDSKARKMIDDGYDFDKKVEEVMTGKGTFEAEDQAAFDMKVSELKSQQKGLRVTDPEFDNIQSQIERLSRASDVAGTIGGRFLQSRRNYNPQEEGISDFISRKKESLGVEKLSDDQKAKVQEVSDKIEAKKSQIKDKSKQIADKIRALRINKGDRAMSNIFSIPVAVYDGAVVTIANVVEQGGNLIDAVNEGIKFIKDNGGFKSKTEESQFKNHILNAGTEEQRLSNYKTRTKKAIENLKNKRAEGDLSKKEKSPIQLDEEAQKLRAELEEERHAFELDILNDEMAKQSWYQRNIATNAKKAIGTLKAITSGIDDSAVFVQNFIPILANPKIGLQSLREHALDFWSAERFNAKMAELHNAKDWNLMKESGLEVLEPTSISEKMKEELMADSFHNAEIKVKGKNVNPLQLLKPFERAFTSLGNNIRVKLFRQQAELLLADGKTFQSHPEEFKSLARAINDLTGRGKLHKSIELASPAITPFIWSPRLLASGLNTLGINDLFYGVQGKKGHYASMTPAQRSFAAKQVVKGMGVGVTVMTGFAIAKAMGADTDIDYDPRSVTFGNVRMGNKNLNVFGRYSPIVKILFQATLGERVKQGKVQDLDNPKYGGKDRGSVVGGFLRGKMTPTAGVGYDFILNHQRDYFTNENLELSDIPKKVAIPMSLNNLRDGLKRDGTLYLLDDFLPNFIGLKVTDQRDFEKKGGSGGGSGATGSVNKPSKPKKPSKPAKN